MIAVGVLIEAFIMGFSGYFGISAAAAFDICAGRGLVDQLRSVRMWPCESIVEETLHTGDCRTLQASGSKHRADVEIVQNVRRLPYRAVQALNHGLEAIAERPLVHVLERVVVSSLARPLDRHGAIEAIVDVQRGAPTFVVVGALSLASATGVFARASGIRRAAAAVGFALYAVLQLVAADLEPYVGDPGPVLLEDGLLPCQFVAQAVVE